MYKTDNCCCCAGLRTGTLIIGWLQLIISTLNIVGGIVYKVNGTSSKDSYVDTLANNEVFWPNMVTSVLSFILALSLLYGVFTNRKRFIYYYLYVSVLVLVIKIIIVVVTLFMGTYSQVGTVICGNLITWAITAYLLIVVYSYHEELAGHN